MLQKQPVPINFAAGLDTKTDPNQLSIASFLSLENSVFTKAKRLTKRNGFGNLTSLPSTTFSFLTTFNDNLLAVSNSLQSLSQGTNTWINKGYIQPLTLSTMPMVRSSTNQIYVDSAISPNNLVCSVYVDSNAGTLTSRVIIEDLTTGESIVHPTNILSLVTPTEPSGSIVGSPRVFLFGQYFIIMTGVLISANNHLQFIAIPYANPIASNGSLNFLPPADISTVYNPPASGLAFDAFALPGGNLYIAFSATSSQVRVTSLSPTLLVSSPTIYTSQVATLMSVCIDTTGAPVIWASYYDSGTSAGHVLAVDSQLHTVLAPTSIITATTVTNITATAQAMVLSVLYEVANNYSYDSSIPTHFIRQNTITQAGVVGTSSILIRSVGLASKAFLFNSVMYFFSEYGSAFQPTYFLMNSSAQVISKFAYSNGGGYLTFGLPSVIVNSTLSTIYVPYLFKDLIQAVNKTQGLASSAGIYSQTGINLATFIFNQDFVSVEMGHDLSMSGGMLWMYDGQNVVEQNFHVWPDSVEVTTSNTGGALKPQIYFYQAIYQWTDSQGNIFQSAPSIPVEVDLSGVTPTPISITSVFSAGVSSIVVSSATGLRVGQFLTDSTTGGNLAANTYITSVVGTTIGLSQPTLGASASSPGDTLTTSDTISNTVNVPTYRLTYKPAGSVKILIFRWSTAQQSYFQVTSIASPTLSSTTVDSIAFVDTQADSSIIGNSLIYTTGGVVEDIAPPATNIITLFDDRLWLVDAEDTNLLWYSKQVIEATPVEMSDLFTVYVAPNIGAQGSTGPITSLGAMDDKLIIFKRDAIYYMNGTGPDNTGANSQYSQPIYIMSTVGCANPNSIAIMPSGLMFQSDKGIWLLGRDLSTQYVGAPVEKYNSNTVVAALTIPGTNQVRFTLDSGVVLMYDYYFNQWGTFSGIPSVDSCLYQNLHTYINANGQVLQETPGLYTDNGKPTVMQFTTSWLNVAGLQGYQRAYFFYLLGTYVSPHRLQVQVAYDYSLSPFHQSTITPNNFSPNYGTGVYGTYSPYGGPGDLEQWRVFFQQQRCQAFQISIQEIYDPSFSVASGPGLTLSGLNCVIGIKKGYVPQPNATSIG